MYQKNRFFTYIGVMGMSLLLHIIIRPYKDKESNISAILFCICDLLGVLAQIPDELMTNPADKHPNPMDESPKIDTGIIDIFLLCSIFITIFVVGIFIIRAIRKQAVATRTGLKGQETNDLFTSFTKLEKILLFPILTLVWIFVKTYYKLFIRKSSEVANKKTKVIPKGKEEEKQGEEKEVDEGGEKREKEKLEQVANRN
jgi:hypothetical protein